MFDRDYQTSALKIDAFCRWGIIVMSTLLLALTLANCSADTDRSRAIDLAVKGGYTPGEAPGTRNQTPQGGTDEKSGRAPSESGK